MANELTLSASFRYQQNGIAQPRSYSDQVTVTGNEFAHNVQTIGTTAEAIDVGDVGTAGYCAFQNLDSTNFVEIGREDTGTFRAVVKLKAGEFAILRSGATLYAKADTASCNLECWVFED